MSPPSKEPCDVPKPPLNGNLWKIIAIAMFSVVVSLVAAGYTQLRVTYDLKSEIVDRDGIKEIVDDKTAPQFAVIEVRLNQIDAKLDRLLARPSPPGMK
jgi:hypothetical protein